MAIKKRTPYRNILPTVSSEWAVGRDIIYYMDKETVKIRSNYETIRHFDQQKLGRKWKCKYLKIGILNRNKSFKSIETEIPD